MELRNSENYCHHFSEWSTRVSKFGDGRAQTFDVLNTPPENDFAFQAGLVRMGASNASRWADLGATEMRQCPLQRTCDGMEN